MNNVATSNFPYGYRAYKLNNIKQLRMIEFIEWAYIPFYEPQQAFKLMNQKQIQALYYKIKKDI